jgi:hypothetical protein
MRYDFREKELSYRRPLWNRVDSVMKKPRWLRRVAYLDTALACETILLLSRGYDPKKLYPINRSPAQLARLTQVLKTRGLPEVSTKGGAGEFHEVCERRLADDIHFDVLSFDGTGHVGSVEHAGGLLGATVKKLSPSVVTVTLLVGRETHETWTWIKDVSALGKKSVRDSRGDEKRESIRTRIGFALMAIVGGHRGTCWFHISDLYWTTYRSTSRQTFAFAVARLVPHASDPHGHQTARNAFAPVCQLPAGAFAQAFGANSR